MTRNEALEIAKQNRNAHITADISNLFHDGSAFDAEKDYGYRHGWYKVGEFSFNSEDITGKPANTYNFD